jgi:hypothetical protein
MTSEHQVAVARHETGVEADPELGRLVSAWDGILHEFRNHLTVLLAAANEIRVATPNSGIRAIADALAETESNVHRLNALVGFVDAAMRDGTSVIADLDDVVARALRLAATSVGRTVVSLHKERRTGVANRGSAFESMLAALLIDLAQADPRSSSAEGGPLQIDIHVEATRGALVLSIESTGRRPPVDSWRFVLASELAARIRATIATLPDGAGYLVRFS